MKKAVLGRPYPFKKEWRSFNKAAAKIGLISEQSNYFETFCRFRVPFVGEGYNAGGGIFFVFFWKKAFNLGFYLYFCIVQT